MQAPEKTIICKHSAAAKHLDTIDICSYCWPPKNFDELYGIVAAIIEHYLTSEKLQTLEIMQQNLKPMLEAMLEEPIEPADTDYILP